MSKNIPYDTILDLLVGDLRSENELTVVLNFLDHTKTVIRHLYWDQHFKNANKK